MFFALRVVLSIRRPILFADSKASNFSVTSSEACSAPMTSVRNSAVEVAQDQSRCERGIGMRSAIDLVCAFEIYVRIGEVAAILRVDVKLSGTRNCVIE